MNESIEKILKFMNAPEMAAFWTAPDFKEASHKRWAIDEILSWIIERPTAPVEDSLNEFMLKMLYFVHTAPSSDIAHIFQIAADMADTIHAMI